MTKTPTERAPLVDAARWPLLRVVYPPDYGDGDAFVRSLGAKLHAAVARRAPGRFVVLADLRRVERRPTAGDRKKIAEMLNELADAFAPPVAEALVLRGELMRLIVQGVTFLQGDKRYPRRIFTSPEEAEAWLHERAREAGLDLPRG
ncbi:MAG TPA: hypothetical protein RMH85_09300 [Polyangiaceae bacterium LLY-WYZ-15_(1-7)]|nr:hypothetical protein [Polyangiaceae bacterium LLY-WYZ-15_(1-7)]HJL01642.1 hypothetical protein [Polyangiaceae bacterium LLY-WYZ-15_(1-7)]HJL08682.1 hypothetical protein [Polyangiaceae bacterium LLY-WYZ-15_(1-7)]HJL24679.1 hypothetical protein [Polyangiaceae bacterium LLY-WYZ-15_(1-7)]HJL28577.1 hypothetical protein [Polyangiaceae bacterium LLY-WYZ-15_(1-7)]